MKPIKTVIKDLNDILDALNKTDPKATRAELQDLLFKAQTDLLKAAKTILGDDDLIRR